MIFRKGVWTVESVELGEGYDGEYNETDPNDVELVRYDFLLEGEDETVDSYCTLIPVADREAVEAMGRIFLDALDGDNPHFPKHTIQQLTWTTPTQAKGA